MPSLPPDRFCAMIPEPMTQAKRKKEPTPSAVMRRLSGGSGIDAIRGEKAIDASVQFAVGFLKGFPLTRSFNSRGIA